MKSVQKSIWPKQIPPLSPEQQEISNDFMKYWHEVLPQRYSVVDRFNHTYPVRMAPVGFHRTLEIGAGLGEHLAYETLTPEQESGYYALELRENMSRRIAERFPQINTVTGDCQEHLDFPEGFFDRALAIHVLEHLPNLPAALCEIHRVLDKDKGQFCAVIPCEGGLAYGLARRLSAQRIFEQRYKQSYRWFISREHINRPREIFRELSVYFDVERRSYFPFPIPLVFCNLVIGMCLKPKKVVR